MISNNPVLTVSEVSNALKNVVEERFGYVHVRGELSDVKIAASGHCYAVLKDAGAVLNVIIWKTGMARLSVRPEEGLDVIATGRMTTYPGRSNYQLVIEKLEVAGEGALLKLIEERRKKLAAEGLFDESRKRALPAFPQRIAVVTSPTGAVIRDILHRLQDRYPCEVWLYPVLVQGEGAAQQIANAITLINTSKDLPDVVIVARGGGSLEDLMAFNDEAVVRAAANCPVPLISAVGHETDTTLIDWAADKRAPTPTAAAEMATPDRAQYLAALRELAKRLPQALQRRAEEAGQRVDHASFRLNSAIETSLEKMSLQLARLRPRSPQELLRLQQQKLEASAKSLSQAASIALDKQAQRLDALARVLNTLSFEKVLERGFVLVRDAHNKPVTSAAALKANDDVTLQFAGQKTRDAKITK